ncbi:MAG: acetylglutamate kinase [Verrucomicrobiales bacterium]|nr:acetylglutamate kinase [Verrucomicrobiales bacterium]
MSAPEFQPQIDKAAVLLEALPYLQNFRGETFLIKVGGSAMDDPDKVRALLRDIVFLEVAGINPVLVHGGGKAISAAMAEAGLEPEFRNGLRVTSDEAMDLVEKTLSGTINPGLVRSIEEFGGTALGVAGNEVFVGERVPELGRVGTVVDFDLGKVEAAISTEVIPVVSPVASEVETQLPLNVNADLAASALAAKLKAAKLVYLSDVIGLCEDKNDPSTLITSVRSDQIETMIEDGTIAGGMIPKVRSSVDALNAGVGKVHMIDGRIRHSLLLEIYTESGIGTEIVTD